VTTVRTGVRCMKRKQNYRACIKVKTSKRARTRLLSADYNLSPNF